MSKFPPPAPEKCSHVTPALSDFCPLCTGPGDWEKCCGNPDVPSFFPYENTCRACGKSVKWIPAPIPAEEEKCCCGHSASEHAGGPLLGTPYLDCYYGVADKFCGCPKYSPAPTVQRENSVGGTISVPCVFPASGVVVATEDNSKTGIRGELAGANPASPGAVGASVAPAPQRCDEQRPQRGTDTEIAQAICTCGHVWHHGHDAADDCATDYCQCEMKNVVPSPAPRRETEWAIEIHSDGSQCNGEDRCIKSPAYPNCDALPIAVTRSSEVEKWAGLAELAKGVAERRAAQLATMREQRDDNYEGLKKKDATITALRESLACSDAGLKYYQRVAMDEEKESAKLRNFIEMLKAENAEKLSTATSSLSRLRQCEEDLKEINTQAVKYAEDYPFITPHASGPQHVDNVVRFSLFIAALAAPAPDVLDKISKKGEAE